MGPRRGLLLLAGGCAISVARAESTFYGLADVEDATKSTTQRHLLQTHETPHNTGHAPAPLWDLQPIVISHPDHHDSDHNTDHDIVIDPETQQGLFVASFLVNLVELILLAIVNLANVVAPITVVGGALPAVLLGGKAGLTTYKALGTSQFALDTAGSQHAIHGSINSQLLALGEEVTSMAGESGQLQADSLRHLMQQVEMLQMQLAELPLTAIAGSADDHSDLIATANKLLTDVMALPNAVDKTSAERAEALVSLAMEVSVLQTELAALTAPVVSANSVVAAETLKAKMKMFDWKKLNPIAWLKNKLGLSKGTLAMGGEELPLQVNAPYGVEPYQVEATPAAPRKLLASER